MPKWAGRRGAALAVAMLLMALTAPALHAANDGKASGDADGIQISADRLVFDNKAQSAVFSGNVTAVQGATSISADRLTVFYDAAEADSGAQPDTQAAIRRIVSEGNVTIRFDDKVAVTRKAIYNRSSGMLELVGEGTRVTSGQNTITGNHITVDRAKDNITVEGGGTRRVEAVIFPGQTDGGGLLPPGAEAGEGEKASP
jgi:lipopolysaccharide export system protein LptA